MHTSSNYLFQLVLWKYRSCHFCICIYICAMLCLVAQLCPTLCNPMDCSPPGSCVHGDSSCKNMGVGSMLSSRESSQPRDWTQVSCIAGGILYHLSHQGCIMYLFLETHLYKFYHRLSIVTKTVSTLLRNQESAHCIQGSNVPSSSYFISRQPWS